MKSNDLACALGAVIGGYHERGRAMMRTPAVAVFSKVSPGANRVVVLPKLEAPTTFKTKDPLNVLRQSLGNSALVQRQPSFAGIGHRALEFQHPGCLIEG